MSTMKHERASECKCMQGVLAKKWNKGFKLGEEKNVAEGREGRMNGTQVLRGPKNYWS